MDDQQTECRAAPGTAPQAPVVRAVRGAARDDGDGPCRPDLDLAELRF